MKLIIKIQDKGWFRGLGLHHTIAPILSITICHFFITPYLAAFFAIWWMGWYGRHEWGWGIFTPPKLFEIMDFLSPALIGVAYIVYTHEILF